MATTTTLGRLLLNDALPSTHQIKQEVSKKDLNTLMSDLARKDPTRYVTTIAEMKRIGDAVATDTGITVGLDDIEPDYAVRDRVLEPYLAKVKQTADPQKKRALIEEAQRKMIELTKKHPGQMTTMALSGARGSVAQLMRSVTSPVAAEDDRNQTIPWIISKSYAEGLKSPDAWIAMAEARRNAVETYTAVAAPGEVSKLLVGNMSDQLITMPDCGTTNGVPMRADDTQVIDRYLAQSVKGFRANTLVTSQVASQLQQSQVIVRSPMTCEAPDGICQRCYGLSTKGQYPQIGANVGMLAAHAMGEPLTQMALNAKHATRTTDSNKAILSGLAGFKQLTEIPQSFFNKATLSNREGTVGTVKAAPQGGNYVWVDDNEHYVPPNLAVHVKPGQHVDAGDALSDGIPKPDEVVRFKGLGAGRKYLVDELQNIYQRNGLDIDKRHLELLAKTDLNYVKMTDQDSPEFGFMRGDIVDYNRFRLAAAKNAQTVAIKDSVGHSLGDTTLHYTAGTTITPTVAQDLTNSGFTKVPVVMNMPRHEPIMKPISRTPLLHPDWLAKMGHRNLKNTILEGAAFGEPSNIHGTHPIPAFVMGEEFGAGPKGRY